MPSRPTKRRRKSDEKPNELLQDDKHRLFTDWATERGVEINGVKAARLPGRGLGLIVTTPIKTGDRILLVPQKAMFTPQINTGKVRDLKAASPQAQLAMSALAAFKKPDSQFTVWKATWPTMEEFERSMPICWPDDLQDMLPPSVLQPLQRQKLDYSKDWTCVQQLCADNDWAELDFKYHWLIVNSRSFHWKPPRGRSGSMVMCPFIDYMNHGPTGTSCNVFQGPKGYEVVAGRDYASVTTCRKLTSTKAVDDEVLATYGAHCNDKLLVHYGFVCSYTFPNPANEDDDIRLDHVILPALSEAVKKQLQDVGFLGAYALLPAKNEICFKTEVAVRAMLLTCNEWEYFVASGEDLTADQTPAVRKFLEPLLMEYRAEALRRLEMLAVMETKTSELAKDLLKGRWTQIHDALDAYIMA